MRLSVVQGGGFVGVVTTTVADAAALAPADADQLRSRVEAAGLLAMSSGPGRPGEPVYEITVEDENRTHQVVMSASELTEGVRALIAWLGEVPGREERIGPPGAG